MLPLLALDLALDALRAFLALDLLAFGALRALGALRLPFLPFLTLRALGPFAAAAACFGLLALAFATAVLLGRSGGRQRHCGDAGD